MTTGNERLVEHYRRVLHAMTHFSQGQKPWDKRGEIYILYGPPAHISKSDDVRYETDADVVKVKDRLLMAITSDGRKEIVARMSRLRTSTRDVQYQGEDAGDLIVSDFESIDYELNPNRSFFGGGEDRNDGNYYDDGNIGSTRTWPAVLKLCLRPWMQGAFMIFPTCLRVAFCRSIIKDCGRLNAPTGWCLRLLPGSRRFIDPGRMNWVFILGRQIFQVRVREVG